MLKHFPRVIPAFLFLFILALPQPGRASDLQYLGIPDLYDDHSAALADLQHYQNTYDVESHFRDMRSALDSWFSDPTSDYHQAYPDATGVNIYETTSHSWYFVSETRFLGAGHKHQSWTSIDQPRVGQPVTYFTAAMFFYASLPNYLVYSETNDRGKRFIVTVATYERQRAPDQSSLKKALRAFKKSELARDPFIQVGLDHVEDIVLIRDIRDDSKQLGSPSQFSIPDNTVYINASDLKNYGWVVLFHELLQAGLYNAKAAGLLGKKNYKTLMRLNFTEFSHLAFGYAGVAGSSDPKAYDKGLTRGKAFALGYTYGKLKRKLLSLPKVEKQKARKFFDDIDANKQIMVWQAARFNVLYHVHLIGISATSEDIEGFKRAFTAPGTDIRRSIATARSQIAARMK